MTTKTVTLEHAGNSTIPYMATDWPFMPNTGLDKLGEAFHGARSTLHEFFHRREEILNDPGLTEIGKNAKLAEIALDPIKKIDDLNHEIINKSKAKLEELKEKIATEPGKSDPNGPAREAEIRSWLLGLSRTDQVKALNQAAHDGDLELIQAALNAPKCFGLLRMPDAKAGEDFRARMETALFGARSPRDLEQVQTIGEGISLAEDSLKTARGHILEASGMKREPIITRNGVPIPNPETNK